jgi:hypothetical protein
MRVARFEIQNPRFLAGVTTVAALGLVAAATGASRPRGTSVSDPRWTLDLGASLLALGAAVSLGLLGYAFGFVRPQRRKRPDWEVASERPPIPWWERVIALVVPLAFFGLLLAALFVHHGTGRSSRPAPRSATSTGRSSPSQGGSGGAGAVGRDSPIIDSWVVASVLGAAGAGIAVTGIVARWRRVRSLATMPDSAKRFAGLGAVEETLDALQHEPDNRRAVIGAYARMERLLDGANLGRKSWEAPFEYLDRILVELGASTTTAATITDLFERAKFSPRAVGPDMKEGAVTALITLRQELEAVS